MSHTEEPYAILWKADGMAHQITLQNSGREGTVLISVSQMRGSGNIETATLAPLERYELAKALYPEAFSDSSEPLVKEEFGVMDRNGRLVKEHAYLNRTLADLIGISPDEQIVTRKVTPWSSYTQEDN